MFETPTFILKQSFTASTPLLLAGFGELIAQRAGVINIGIEGMMLMGAIAGYAAAVATNSAPAAIPAAIFAGTLFAALFSLATIRFKADQIVTGTAINILALGASTTIWRILQTYMAPIDPSTGNPLHPAPPLFTPTAVPILSKIPVLGPALFDQYALLYLVLLLAITFYLLLEHTRFGLIIKALGDNPDAADAAGIPVRRWRFLLVLFAGACAGLAGAYLSTMRTHSFQENMTAGQGFLVLALVIFGRWKIAGLIAGTLLFGILQGLQSYLTSLPGATQKIPHQLFDMLPYAATLLALAFLSKSKTAPLHLARPWPESGSD
jgi:simple sugar transport system permease protein